MIPQQHGRTEPPALDRLHRGGVVGQLQQVLIVALSLCLFIIVASKECIQMITHLQSRHRKSSGQGLFSLAARRGGHSLHTNKLWSQRLDGTRTPYTHHRSNQSVRPRCLRTACPCELERMRQYSQAYHRRVIILDQCLLWRIYGRRAIPGCCCGGRWH